MRIELKKDRVSMSEIEYRQVMNKLNQYKSERDTLIDDLSWYKSKVSRLERENRDLKHENKALRLQSNTYFDEWQESEKQRNEFISYINLYTTLTNHIRLKAEMNPGVSRYIELVNYIDRLERADDER